MKKLFMLLAAMAVLFFAFGCGQGAAEDATTAETAERGADTAASRETADLE